VHPKGGERFPRTGALCPRVSVRPKLGWSDEDYSAAADRKLGGSHKICSEFLQWGGTLDGAQVLEVGCGSGIDVLLVGLYPVRSVVGIDLELPLFEPGERGERTRGLAREVLEKRQLRDHVREVLESRPIRFAIMDATLMGFPDDSFDFLWSRAAMLEIMPLEKALTEMARVVRPGGLIYHNIHPYFWIRGCYKTGLVDIPWAHARLSPAEFRRFATESEGEATAIRRCQGLKTLNQFTLRQWRKMIGAGPFEILEWKEDRCSFAERLLEEHPDAKDSLLEGVEPRDLIHGGIKVWLRKKDHRANEDEDVSSVPVDDRSSPKLPVKG